MLKLEKLPQIIATVGIMIYIMGFITITSYLNSLHIVESVSIDGKLLKTGILTLFLIIPLLGFFVTQFKDGNFVDNVPAKLLRITLLIAYIDVFFNNYVMINSVNNAQIALIFIGLLIGFFEKVFPAKFEKVKELISVILLIVILTIAILSSFKISTYLPDLSLFAFHGIIILGFLTYFLIIDEKNYLKTSALFSAFLGICLGCTFLGGRLLSQIKPQYGGETQKYCRLFFKADFIQQLKIVNLVMNFTERIINY